MLAGTDPNPWPRDGALAPTRLAMVIAGAGQEPLTGTMARTAAAVRQAGGLVLWVHPRRGPSTAIPCTDVSVPATGIDGFHGSGLDDALRADGRDLLVLAGFGLETTVHSTLRSANDRGYECLTLTDAVVPVEDALRDAALSSICMSGGIFGAIGTSAALIAALSEFT